MRGVKAAYGKQASVAVPPCELTTELTFRSLSCDDRYKALTVCFIPVSLIKGSLLYMEPIARSDNEEVSFISVVDAVTYYPAAAKKCKQIGGDGIDCNENVSLYQGVLFWL